jgi:hypothetical protein
MAVLYMDPIMAFDDFGGSCGTDRARRSEFDSGRGLADVLS